MKRTALVLTVACLALTACGGGDSEDTASAAASSPSAGPATITVTTTAAAPLEDAAGKGNCIGAQLAYAPIASALDGSVDLDRAVQLFSASDVDSATSQPGKDAAVAIAEANYELALANTNTLTGQPVDASKLRTLLTAVDEACATVMSN